MKKILSIILYFMLCLGLIGCSSNNSKTTEISSVEESSQEQNEKTETEQNSKEDQEEKDEVEQEENKTVGYNSIGTPSERPVMNGTKTERIGTYLDAVCNNEFLTDEELIQFYKDYVKDTDYNWVQLRFSDGTGLYFSDCFFTYCTLDVENGISNEKGNGVIYIESNKVEYEGEDYTK